MNEFKQMLFISGMPPSGGAGAPVIYRQLLHQYNPERLDVLYCGSWDKEWRARMAETLLPCRHTAIWSVPGARWKPARVFGPIVRTLSLARIPAIMRVARRIIRERRVDVIFNASTFCEFNLAAYFLHCETGLPLYYFETDDWELSNPTSLPRSLVRNYQGTLYRAATKLWFISHAMVRDYKARFGVCGEFLFNFLDSEPYTMAARHNVPPPPPGPVELVYTGSINLMFFSTLRRLCQYLNSGLTVDGRQVRLTIFGPGCPDELLGSAVTYAGLVNHAEIPPILARAHALLIAITFNRDPYFLPFLKTNIFTKTLDYLASGRPVLLVAPEDTAEVEYCRNVAHIVSTTDRVDFVAALNRLMSDSDYVTELCRRGQALVRDRHSLVALEQQFLRHFRQNYA